MPYQKKWNNQGGSGRGDKYRKPKKDVPNIPQFDKLPESNTVSFRVSQPRNANSQSTGFDGELISWELIIDELFDPDIYNPSDNSDELGNAELPLISDRTRTIPVKSDIEYTYNTIEKSQTIVPESAYKEYEIIVKYKKLILTILSGQAYACRNDLNNPLLDFAIVIISSEPIQIGQNPPGTLNVFQMLGSTQDPMFAVYNWILDKIGIVTDNSGRQEDPILRRLARRGIPLPSISFTYNNKQYDLFNGSGKSPSQICLHATNNVLKFEPSTPKNASWKWTVLAPGDPVSTCLTNLRIVSIGLAPGSADELESGSGMSFVFRISIDRQYDKPLSILYELNTDILPSFYTVSGASIDGEGRPIIEIPANTSYVDVSIEPLDNPSEQDDKTIELKLLDDDDSDIYEIDGDLNSELVTVKPSEADISSICFRVIRQSPYIGRPIGQNIRANVWGSNSSIPVLDFTDINYPDFNATGQLSLPGKQALITDNFASSYLSSYGLAGNFYKREYFDFPSIITNDLIVSKAVIKDWAAAINVRYIHFFCGSPLAITDTSDQNLNSPTDQSAPNPATRSDADIEAFRVSFSSFPMPVNNGGIISLSDAPNTYPSETVDSFGSALTSFIELVTYQYYLPTDLNPGFLYWLRSARCYVFQTGIEFDLLTDPNLENPRIIPVATTNTISPVHPRPLPGSGGVTVFTNTSSQSVGLFQQLTQP